MDKLPFRMRAAAFCYGFTHPFNTDAGRLRTARDIYQQYKHLIAVPVAPETTAREKSVSVLRQEDL